MAARRRVIARARASLAVLDPRAKPRGLKSLADLIEQMQGQLDEVLDPLPAWLLEMCDRASAAQEEGSAAADDEA